MRPREGIAQKAMVEQSHRQQSAPQSAPREAAWQKRPGSGVRPGGRTSGQRAMQTRDRRRPPKSSGPTPEAAAVVRPGL